MQSSDSSATGRYSDGVYSVIKPDAQSSYVVVDTAKPLPQVKPPMLPTVMLATLLLLFAFCFIGILVSGLHFDHRVSSGDCLGQSWVMFSSILGVLYIALHLQAARKSEPVNRSQPPSQHPLHAAAIVVARLDAVAWTVSLIIVAVAVSKQPSAVSCVDLVACTAVVPAFIFILAVDEKAIRPFDLPYLTTPSSAASSTITCRVSDFMKTMPEVSVDDSISRRASSHSTSSQRAAPRPNSHTHHAAAIAAANIGQPRALSGPRPPPSSVKEARPWNFTNFDGRTKVELAASVTEATQTSEHIPHVGGPRALALSEKAMQTGMLPPPVCLAPKVVALPQREEDKENTIARPSSNASSGAGRQDRSNLATETGYRSATTMPASTPALGSHASLKPSHRGLSPVREEARRLSRAPQQPSLVPAYQPRRPDVPAPLAPAPLAIPSTRPRPQSTAAPATTYNSYNNPSAPNKYSYSHSASIPKPPPPAATDASAPARVRLARAQEALKLRGGARDTVVLLKRPPRFTGDGRGLEQSRSVVSAPPARVRPEYLRMPGSFDNY